MKTRLIFCLSALLLLNSCIINSLFPFYTSDTISFKNTLLGIWKDKKNSDDRWIINSNENINRILKHTYISRSEKEIDLQTKYKQGYFAIHEEVKANRISIFLAMPFKIDNQLFLDFTPLIYDEDINHLISHHLIPTHSLAKFDIIDDDTINIKWLSSEKIGDLIENNKIKINYEKVGFEEETILLTASPDELQKFIKKYMASNDTNKWKTDVKLSLKRINSPQESINLMEEVLNGTKKLSGKITFH